MEKENPNQNLGEHTESLHKNEHWTQPKASKNSYITGLKVNNTLYPGQ